MQELRDAFQLIQSLPVETLDKRIAWLEAALSVHKTIKALRMVMDQKPQDLEFPVEPVVVPPEPDPKPVVKFSTSDKGIQTRLSVEKVLIERGPMSVQAIAGVLERKYGTVYVVLKNNQDRFYRNDETGTWEMKRAVSSNGVK